MSGSYAWLNSGGAIKEHETLCRDYMLNDKDIDNLAKGLDEYEWRFNPDDANSIHIWTQRNPQSTVLYQQQQESQQQIFTLAISDPWQQDQLRKHGHGKAVLLDGTFGTNSKKVCAPVMLSKDGQRQAICLFFTDNPDLHAVPPCHIDGDGSASQWHPCCLGIDWSQRRARRVYGQMDEQAEAAHGPRVASFLLHCR